MEVQLHGMASTKEDFELKLRAAGTVSPPTAFSVEESVWSVPSATGAVQGQVRLIPEVPKDLEDAEEQPIGRGDGDSWLMVHEAEIKTEKEGTVRVVQVDRVSLKGDAPEVLKQLGFVEKFTIGRRGTRVVLPGDWIVEYFDLFQPITEMNGETSNKKPRVFSMEKGKTGWLVTIKKRFNNEHDIQTHVANGWRIARRLMPDLELAKSLDMYKLER